MFRRCASNPEARVTLMEGEAALQFTRKTEIGEDNAFGTSIDEIRGKNQCQATDLLFLGREKTLSNTEIDFKGVGSFFSSLHRGKER